MAAGLGLVVGREAVDYELRLLPRVERRAPADVGGVPGKNAGWSKVLPAKEHI